MIGYQDVIRAYRIALKVGQNFLRTVFIHVSIHAQQQAGLVSVLQEQGWSAAKVYTDNNPSSRNTTVCNNIGTSVVCELRSSTASHLPTSAFSPFIQILDIPLTFEPADC